MEQKGVCGLSTSSSFCMYSGSFRSRPAFSSSLELGSMNLCRNLWEWRSPKCATVKTQPFVLRKGFICKWLTTKISYLELLLAGANVDIGAPDHQPLTGVCLTGCRSISTGLQEFTRNINCWGYTEFLSISKDPKKIECQISTVASYPEQHSCEVVTLAIAKVKSLPARSLQEIF